MLRCTVVQTMETTGLNDLLAEFNPFLADHIQMHGNPGKGNVPYLLSTIFEEFIDLLASEVI